MADEDQPGYMPTVDVVGIVRDHFKAGYVQRCSCAYVRRLAERNGYGQFNVLQDPEHALTNAMAVEITCREILDANRWMLEAAPTVRTR